MSKVLLYREIGSDKHWDSCFLHRSLAGVGELGPAAQEHTHGEDEHNESHCHRRGHQNETAITRLIPWCILCETDESDMKGNMHHTEYKISKTTSFLPLGKASKGNLLFVCGRQDCRSGVQMVIVLHAALIFKTSTWPLADSCFPFMC